MGWYLYQPRLFLTFNSPILTMYAIKNHKPFFRNYTALTSKFVNLVLIKVLPRKTKRLIFLSSIVATIKNIREPDKFLMDKVNKLLRLSEKDTAMALPMYAHSLIWRNTLHEIKNSASFENIKNIDELSNVSLTRRDIRAMTNAIINKTPEWLIYGNRSEVCKDLITIFKNFTGNKDSVHIL